MNGCHTTPSNEIIPAGTSVPDSLVEITASPTPATPNSPSVVIPQSSTTPFGKQFILVYKPGGEFILQDIHTGETRRLPDQFRISEEGFLGWTNRGCGLYVRMENYDIVEIDLEGEILRKVYESEKIITLYGDTASLWAKPSPDETHLAFISRAGARIEYANYGYHFDREELMLVKADFSITPYSLSSGGGAWIYAWSPDSSKIAFTDFDASGNAQVYIADLLSRDKYPLTNFDAQRRIPSELLWAQDGESIALLFPREEPGWDVVVKNIEGDEILSVDGIRQFWWDGDGTFGVIKDSSIQLFDATAGSLLKDMDIPASGSTPKYFGRTHQLACLSDCFGNQGYGLVIFDLDSQEMTQYPNLIQNFDIAGWEASDLEFPGETKCK
jgi:hypothetical protein